MARYRPTEQEVRQTTDLRARAKKAGLRDRDMAELLGVTRSAISQYGKKNRYGYVACIPSEHIQAIEQAIRERERTRRADLGDEFERSARLSQLLRDLAYETHAAGPRWEMVVATVETALDQERNARTPEEENGTASG